MEIIPYEIENKNGESLKLSNIEIAIDNNFTSNNMFLKQSNQDNESQYLDTQIIIDKDIALKLVGMFIDLDHVVYNDPDGRTYSFRNKNFPSPTFNGFSFLEDIEDWEKNQYSLSVFVGDEIFCKYFTFDKAKKKRIENQKRLKVKSKLLYTLRPMYIRKTKKTVWYLNVSCNPTTLISNDLDRVILEKRQLSYKETVDLTTRLYCSGYMALESFSKMKKISSKDFESKSITNANRISKLNFEWPDKYRIKINNGEVELRSVSFSIFRTNLGINRDQIWREIKKLYSGEYACDRTVIKNNKETISGKDYISIGKWLKLDVNYKEGKSKNDKDYFQIKKRYQNRTVKFIVRVYRHNHLVGVNEDLKKVSSRELRFQVLFHPSYIREVLSIDSHKVLTVRDFVEKTINKICPTIENHYNKAKEMVDRVLNDEIYLTQLLTFDPLAIANLHYKEGINFDGETEKSLFEAWRRGSLYITENNYLKGMKPVDEQAKVSNQSRRMYFNNKLSLLEKGVNIEIPFKVYVSIAHDRLMETMTLSEKFNQLAIAAGVDEEKIQVVSLISLAKRLSRRNDKLVNLWLNRGKKITLRKMRVGGYLI